MILFTNGCSFTWGGGMEFSSDEERLQNVWPHHLGNLLNADKVVNLGMGCGSNQRILRTTFDWIRSQTAETLENTVAVIQWSSLNRYEYYFPTLFGDKNENIPDRWALAKEGCIISPERTDWEKRRNEIRFETNTAIEELYTHIMHCEAMESLFKRHNVRYCYWVFGLEADRPAYLQDYLSSSFNWVPRAHELDYEKLVNDAHPSILGHTQIAEYIHKYIKDKI